jgi:hypothetical protein
VTAALEASHHFLDVPTEQLAADRHIEVISSHLY